MATDRRVGARQPREGHGTLVILRTGQLYRTAALGPRLSLPQFRQDRPGQSGEFVRRSRFAALEAPDLYTADGQAFFSLLG